MKLKKIYTEKQLRDGWYIRAFIRDRLDNDGKLVCTPILSLVQVTGRAKNRGGKSSDLSKSRIVSTDGYSSYSFLSDLGIGANYNGASLMKFSNKAFRYLKSLMDNPKEFFYAIHPDGNWDAYLETAYDMASLDAISEKYWDDHYEEEYDDHYDERNNEELDNAE